MRTPTQSILFWGNQLIASKSFKAAVKRSFESIERVYRDEQFNIEYSLLTQPSLVVIEINDTFNPTQVLKHTWPDVPAIVIADKKHSSQLAEVLETSFYEILLADKKEAYLQLLFPLIQRLLDRKVSRFSIPHEHKEEGMTENGDVEDKRSDIDFKKLYSLLRTMTDTVPDMIWAKDLNGKYIYTNTSTCQHLLNSHNTHEPIGRDIMEFVQRERDEHPEDTMWYSYGENCASTDRETLLKGKMCRFKESGTVMGSYVILDIYKAPLVDDDGQLIGTVGTARDITLHEETKERYRKLFDNSPNPVVVHVNGIVIAANQAAADFVGAESIEEHLGKSVFDFVHPDFRAGALNRVSLGPEAAGLKKPSEEKYLMLDGTIRDVETVSVTMKYGNQEAWMVTFRDITEQKEVREQVQRSLREKEALLQEIYHRTKNNMQVVSSIINIRSRDVDDQLSVQMFKEIRDRISAMSLAHDQLYASQDLSAIEFEPYLKHLSNQLCQSYSEVSSRVPIQIDSERLIISIDQAVPLGLVINEILTNAYKYAFPERQAGKIELQLKHKGLEALEIMIQDNGIGLPIDAFNDSLSTVIISGLVEDQLGGTIEYDGEKGARFLIQIPNKEVVRRI